MGGTKKEAAVGSCVCLAVVGEVAFHEVGFDVGAGSEGMPVRCWRVGRWVGLDWRTRLSPGGDAGEGYLKGGEAAADGGFEEDVALSKDAALRFDAEEVFECGGFGGVGVEERVEVGEVGKKGVACLSGVGAEVAECFVSLTLVL